MIRESDCVALTEDLPEVGLKADDQGTAVLVHQGGKGCEVEFLRIDGDTVAAVSLFARQVRGVHPDEIARARRLAVGTG